MKESCIGLFGTCGGSKWRDPFIEVYGQQGINFYNPNKADWKPEDAFEESVHLMTDDIILFPITSETFGTASLAETGFSLLTAVRADTSRFVVIMIDEKCDPKLQEENARAYKESNNARAIVRSHLSKIITPNLLVCNNLNQMLDVSVHLWNVVQHIAEARRICAA